MSNFTLFNNDTAKSQNSAQSVGDSFYERVSIICVLVLLEASICGCAFLYDECIKVLKERRKKEENDLCEDLQGYRKLNDNVADQEIKSPPAKLEGRKRSSSV